MKSWLMKGAIGFCGLFFAVCFVGMSGGVWLFQVPFFLVAGWAFFLERVLPQVSWDWSAIAQTVVVVAVLGAGGHAFASRAWRRVRPQDTRPWPVRWTASLIGLVVLLFCATMATVGVGHHVGWLATSSEPLLESNWPLAQLRSRRQREVLCEGAVEALRRDPSGASLSHALLTDPDLDGASEQWHTVLVPGTGDARTLLVFARDPGQREEQGVMRCELPGAKVHYPASALPRLLAGEAVAGGTPDY